MVRIIDLSQEIYEGMPLYFYFEDVAPGEAKGDGLGDVWHVITSDESVSPEDGSFDY